MHHSEKGLQMSYMHHLKTNNTRSMCMAYFSSAEPLWWNSPPWLPLAVFPCTLPSFSPQHSLTPESAFCFKAAALITLASDVSSLHDGVRRQPRRRGISAEMICINDRWRWRGEDDEKRQNDMRQKERRSCQLECGWWAPDHCSNEAPLTFFIFPPRY